MWEGSLDLICENPILGTGLNSFRPVFGRHAPVEYVRGEGLERFPDKAHRVFLGMVVALSLGGHLLEKGRVDEAILEWRKNLLVEPENADACFWVGEACRQRGDNRQAELMYRTVLSLNPHLEVSRQRREQLGVAVPRATPPAGTEGG